MRFRIFNLLLFPPAGAGQFRSRQDPLPLGNGSAPSTLGFVLVNLADDRLYAKADRLMAHD